MTGKPANTSFSVDIPQLQFAWDSTSLGLLKTCPRKYYLTMVEGWVKRITSIHLDFGIQYHKVLEAYDHARAQGQDHDAAVITTVRAQLDLGSLDANGTWQPWDTSRDENDYGLKNKETLLRSTVWYLEHFRDDPTRTVILDSGKPAVELSFKINTQVTAPDGHEYLLCGHLDRVVEFGDAVYVLDRKTSKSALTTHYFNQYNPNNQITLYTLAGQIVLKSPVRGVIIDAAQLAVNFTRFARHITTRTKAQLDEWYRDVFAYIRQAERFAQDEHWPMNDTACDKFGGCPFRGVCGADPAVRSMYLKQDFTQRTWDPLISREA